MSIIEIISKEESVEIEGLKHLKYNDDVNRVVVTPKFIIAVSRDDCSIGIFDLKTFRLLDTIKVSVLRDVVEWDNNTIICCCGGGKIKVLSLQDTHPKVVKLYDMQSDYSGSSFSWYRLLKIDDVHFVAGHLSGISLFSFEKGHLKKFTHDEEVHISWYSNICLSPKQHGIFYTGHINCIKSWNCRTLKHEKTYKESYFDLECSRIFDFTVFLNQTNQTETIVTFVKGGGVFFYNAESEHTSSRPFMCVPKNLGASICITSYCWTSSNYISTSHSDYLLLGDAYGLLCLFRVCLEKKQLEMIYKGMRCVAGIGNSEIIVFGFKNVNVSEDEEEDVLLEERIQYVKEMYKSGDEENLFMSIILENCRIENVSKLLFL